MTTLTSLKIAAANQGATIGSRIKQARKEKSINQAELATRLGVSQPTVANWESGIHDPRQMMLAKIAEALEVPLGWLGSGERSAEERDKTASAAYLRRGLYHVPIVEVNEAITYLNREQFDLHELATDYIPVTSGSETLLAFFVNDAAMNLVFPGNTLAVVDYHHRIPVDGDIVLMKRSDDKAVLRRWRANPARLEPYSSDPSHETIYVDDLQGIIGIVIVSIRIH